MAGIDAFTESKARTDAGDWRGLSAKTDCSAQTERRLNAGAMAGKKVRYTKALQLCARPIDGRVALVER
jgi:hypothetical protein